MERLAGHEGAWVGTNAFRLMPGDPAQDAPMRATVAPAAGGMLAQIAYTWAHPDDDAQEGLLVLGRGADDGAAAAFWGDSWHQHPEPRTLEGRVDGAVVTVGYAYGGDWRWEVVVDASAPDRLAVTMNNVVPEAAATAELPAGAYAAMHAVLRRGD